jgi:hypothetical protein
MQISADLYKKRATQCLAVVNSDNSSLESLKIMVYIGVVRFIYGTLYEERNISDTTLFDMVGSFVRRAVRLGLYRDPAHFSNISLFQGEMRRRLWAFIRQIDLLSSFNLGLPSIVRVDDADTKDPLNICDIDLNEYMIDLPPERLPSLGTPISYLIVKNRILHVIGHVMEHLNSLHGETYEDTLRIDRDLIKAHESVPPHLRMGLWSEPGDDPPYIVAQKMRLDLLFHEATCVLHRRYLKSDPKYATSSSKCIKSSMTMLHHQELVHKELQPGGRLEHSRWYVVGPDNQSFALATMMICLHLEYEHHHKSSTGKIKQREAEMSSDRKELWAA